METLQKPKPLSESLTCVGHIVTLACYWEEFFVGHCKSGRLIFTTKMEIDDAKLVTIDTTVSTTECLNAK